MEVWVCICIHFTKQCLIRNDDTAGVVIDTNQVTLDAINKSKCVTLFMEDNQMCDGERQVTVSATLKNTQEYNLKFRQQYITVVVAERKSMKGLN